MFFFNHLLKVHYFICFAERLFCNGSTFIRMIDEQFGNDSYKESAYCECKEEFQENYRFIILFPDYPVRREPFSIYMHAALFPRLIF